MPKYQAPIEPDSIFALDKNKPFADTSIETWKAIRSMTCDLDELQRQGQRTRKNDTQERADELCRKHPFLAFTNGKPKPGNPYWELKARIRIWSGAFDTLNYSQSEEERQHQDCFEHFEDRYSLGRYKFLWKQPYMSAQEMLVLHRYAYGELWAFTQSLKLKNLTPEQEQDRQKLELWTISEIKETLICHELEPANASRGRLGWKFFEEDRETATRIVEARIAKGDWQMPRTCKFKFNGCSTDDAV
ncbi:hypothetical protein MMC22_010156 [Lobaria immixta]|nr:hypothetical protein [Lobaria immixta]